MAYSNWGATVYKNGERQRNREDVGVFDEDEASLPSGMRIFANLLKREGEVGEERKFYKHSHHAVLGTGPVRLVGYKCWASLYVLQPNGEVKDITLPSICDNDGSVERAVYHFYEPVVKEGEKDAVMEGSGDYTYSLFHRDGNMLDLELTEPDGTKWTATCGYMYGAGFEDDDGTKE